jgi:RNA-directed DNA polymerase
LARRSIRRLVLPAASRDALKAIRQTVRRWELLHRTDMTLNDLARRYNPPIRGWINYYSHFYKSALAWTLRRVDAFLIRWARNKFKRLRLRPRGAREWFSRVVAAAPNP